MNVKSPALTAVTQGTRRVRESLRAMVPHVPAVPPLELSQPGESDEVRALRSLERLDLKLERRQYLRDALKLAAVICAPLLVAALIARLARNHH